MGAEHFSSLGNVKILIRSFFFFPVLKFNAIYQVDFILAQVAVGYPLGFLMTFFTKISVLLNTVIMQPGSVFKAVIFIKKSNVRSNTYI